MKLPSYKNFFLNVDRKGIYFIWVMLKSRKAELKQVKSKFSKVSLTCFAMIVAIIYGLF